MEPDCREQKGHPKGQPEASPNDPFARRMSPKLREAVESLRKQEDKILKVLEKKEVQEEFLRDPAAVLEKAGIKIPPLLRKRLKPDADPAAHLKIDPIRLPTGQVVSPKVRVNIVKTKEADDARR